MIGPTGVGKTEIARRLARLAQAPFIKVEATKFTEVGYVGREVDSIIRDLVDVAVKMTAKMRWTRCVTAPRTPPRSACSTPAAAASPASVTADAERSRSDTRQKFRKMLREGKLDDKEIEIEIQACPMGVEIMAPPGMEEMTSQLQGMFQNLGGNRARPANSRSRRPYACDGRRSGEDDQRGRAQAQALEDVEQHGIVFLDELDKVARRSETQGADVSREGVQRDLLPLVEGCTVNTKYGMVKTDHILFIASGAFHVSKPSDLIPELQGRFPIRVELKSLTTEDFVRILTEPDASLTSQYAALLETEEVHLEFAESGVTRLAESSLSRSMRTPRTLARGACTR